MEIKVGEYVRSHIGSIGKVTRIESNSNTQFLYEDETLITIDKNVVKHSPNIIELIEIGDYVNGYLINYIPNNEKAIYHDASDCEDVEEFENKDIETIVTHEQFAGMEYKVC